MNNLIHWDPFRELNRLSNALGSGRTELARSEGREWAPAVDISEDDESFIITADLPDVSKEDVNVSVQHGCLTLSGERKLEKQEEDKEKKYHRIERSYGSYTRSFSLPKNVDAAAVKANFQNGVLNIILPKVAAEEGPDKIQVEID